MAKQLETFSGKDIAFAHQAMVVSLITALVAKGVFAVEEMRLLGDEAVKHAATRMPDPSKPSLRLTSPAC